MLEQGRSPRLAEVAPDLEEILQRGSEIRAPLAAHDIRRETVWVRMRDGVRLATDLYLPPKLPAPAVAMRTPYGRANEKYMPVFTLLARFGYVVLAQDCRGTGDSEPDAWDYYVYESEDGLDFVEWASQCDWFDGFLAGCGGSYAGQTQWCMATHPLVSAIAPEVSGLGLAINTAHIHMFINAYARSVGKGEGKVQIHYSELESLMLPETLATGYFNEPLHRPLTEALLRRYPQLRGLRHKDAQRWLWKEYCSLSSAQRASLIKDSLGTERIGILEAESLSSVFGQRISHDAHALPRENPSDTCRSILAPALLITGWYDWGLNDALETWRLLRLEASEPVRSLSRLIITPAAHNKPGYHEGSETHPELQRSHRMPNQLGLLLAWYAAVRDGATDRWPRVIYYLMGANQWRTAADWPPPEGRQLTLYLHGAGQLTPQMSCEHSVPDSYSYDPDDPTPTVGGSIVSNVYTPGSADVSEAQQRADLLVYTTPPLDRDLDIVGPVRLVLHASSTAVDTDFVARISDVFPDGRAIQLQTGVLRARYRDLEGEPQLLEPERIYCFEIDLWATANRFKAGHSLRLDISSADFPRFDRNTNRGGTAGTPIAATQTIHHDSQYPSRLIVMTLTGS